MDPARFTRVDETTWRIEPQGAMRVPAIIYADEDLIRDMDDKVYEQAANVAKLPGIVQASYAMPDAHWGYGFPIGGVAAFDPDEGGVVSAGGVGFDISCGVRTMLTGLKVADILPVQKALADSLYRQIPAGVGSTGAITLDAIEMDAMLTGGARWAVERGWGEARDLERIEEGGRMAGAEPERSLRPRQEAPAPRDGHARLRQSLSRSAGGRGDLRRRSRRGLRACSRTTSWSPSIAARAVWATRSAPSSSRRWWSRREAAGITLPDRELACAPIKSEIGQRYLGAMRAAINCALANREILGHFARRVFAHFFPDHDLSLLFDVSHNTCKVEAHVVDGKRRELFVHRKGATRAFGPGHASLPEALRAVGQPVLIGGSMGTGSYILVGEAVGRAEGVLVRLPRRRPRHVAPCRAQAMERAQDPGRSGGARHSDPQPVDARHRRGGARRLQGCRRGRAGGRACRARPPRRAPAAADLHQGVIGSLSFWSAHQVVGSALPVARFSSH